jgi:hypothetical protein
MDSRHDSPRDSCIDNAIYSSSVDNLDATIRKGEQWLESNKQTFIAETEVGISFQDNFADLLILQLSNRWFVLVFDAESKTVPY